jgi:hypothetical protein
MANLNPISFLLNQSDEAKEDEVVEAPAFSLTKVLSAGAIIIAPIAAIVVDNLKDQGLTSQHYVILAVGLLGFLAIATAADVLARSHATAARENAQAAAAAIAQFTPFQVLLKGHPLLGSKKKPNPEVDVLASAQAGEHYFLVKEGDSITWRPASGIQIS